MKTLARGGRSTQRRPRGGLIWGLALVVALAMAVWGAWRLGVMSGDQAVWRQALLAAPRIARRAPNPQPIPLPTPRKPGAERR